MTKFQRWGFLLLILGLSACHYDTLSDIYPDHSSECDTLNLSFKTHILPIFEMHCNNNSCHGGNFSQGRVNLTDYQGVAEVVSDGRLVGVINHFSGFTPMPADGGKLETCKIKRIESWVNDGFPNN